MGRATQVKPRRTKVTHKKRGGVDIQALLSQLGCEFHWPGYQYMGPGTQLKTRLRRGDPGINRLDRIAKQHDMDYAKAKDLKDKWMADRKMIHAIDQLPGDKTWTETAVRLIMRFKVKLGF